MMTNNILELPKKFRDPETASIDMIRQSFNLPNDERLKYLKRVYDEELSLVTEALNGFINIPFDFDLLGDQLVAANGETFSDINIKGIEYYRQKAELDDRYNFMVQRAISEYQESLEAEKIARNLIENKTLVTISPYPEEAERLYGKEFVQSLGFHTDTKRAMLRAIQKTDSGIRLYTRAVDESNLSIWNQILPSDYRVQNTDDMLNKVLYFDSDAVNALDSLQVEYQSINKQSTVANHNNDVWEFVHQKQDLIEYFNCQLFELSRSNLHGQELKKEVNKLRRDFWSAIKLSHENYKKGESYMAESNVSDIFSVSGAVTEARRETFVSCGMAISPTDQLSTKDMLQEIFGQKDILKCVKCPYCNKTVDAKVSKGTIECLNKRCGAKLNTYSGKRIDKNSKNKTFIDFILELFFSNNNSNSKKTK